LASRTDVPEKPSRSKVSESKSPPQKAAGIATDHGDPAEFAAPKGRRACVDLFRTGDAGAGGFERPSEVAIRLGLERLIAASLQQEEAAGTGNQ